MQVLDSYDYFFLLEVSYIKLALKMALEELSFQRIVFAEINKGI